MRHVRIPVSWGHEEAGNFGFLYFWQDMPHGAIGSRLLYVDNTVWPYQKEWDNTRGHSALAESERVPFEQDIFDIMSDCYGWVRQAGTLQTRSGRQWIGNSGLVMSKRL